MRARSKLLLGFAAAAAAAVVVFAAGVMVGDAADDGSGSRERERRASPDVVSRISRATVHIESLPVPGGKRYIGSGSIIDRRGLILTNAHVGRPTAPGLALQYGPGENQEPTGLVISLFEEEKAPARPRYRAKVMAYDGYLDVAVLQINATDKGEPLDAAKLNLPTIELGDSNALRRGDSIIVVGYPGVGGGFERSINVSTGTFSGPQKDPRIDDLTGWIKTDAEIAHGNSGGVAANDAGQLIGIPTRFQCGPSLDAPGCDPTADKQGKIRPLALARPVIDAARAGSAFKSPYFVAGTGSEEAESAGWTAAPPDLSSCSFQEVASFQSGTTAITAVWRTRGMTPGEDLLHQWIYAPSPQSRDVRIVGWQRGRWKEEWGNGFDCFTSTLEAPGGLDDGFYVALLRAGPTLELVGKASVTVKKAGSGDGDGNGGGVPPTGSTSQECANWTPAGFLQTGVEVKQVLLGNGDVVAYGGRIGLIAGLGDLGGYDRLAEADAAALGGLWSRRPTPWEYHRWIVLAHRGRYYAYVGKHPDGGIDDPHQPCLIPESSATLVADHALKFTDSGTMQYDWTIETGGRITPVNPFP